MTAYLLEVNLAAFSCYIINNCQPTSDCHLTSLGLPKGKAFADLQMCV